MFSWILRIRQKPEGTRRAIAVLLFLLIGGIILTIWLWGISGNFPYRSVIAARTRLGAGFEHVLRGIQDVRLKLGELKQNLLSAFSES